MDYFVCMCKLTLTDDMIQYSRVVTCTKPYGTRFHLAIETRGCELTLEGRPCVTRLKQLMVIQGVCSALSDGLTYECLFNIDYTDPICCLLYEDGSTKPVSNSCIPSKSLLVSIMIMIETIL